ncbi:MAG TPA: hypothetical protein DCY89_02780, partial [Gammaproteobacteria bacterium]|nr:hypothetical protein [Gammaproteobacteria bacterium]
PLDLQGPPPRRLAGQGIRLQRPAGADRRWLLGWLTELQLLLHGAAENARRVAIGLPPVNSVWPWGGGVWPPAPVASAVSARSVPATSPVTMGSPRVVYADCAFARGLARAAELPGSSIRPLAALAEAPAPAAGILVVHDPGPGVAIDPVAAETLWAAPLLAALAAGRLREIVIDSPTARQRIARHHRLRFWRRR